MEEGRWLLSRSGGGAPSFGDSMCGETRGGGSRRGGGGRRPCVVAAPRRRGRRPVNAPGVSSRLHWEGGRGRTSQGRPPPSMRRPPRGELKVATGRKLACALAGLCSSALCARHARSAGSPRNALSLLCRHTAWSSPRFIGPPSGSEMRERERKKRGGLGGGNG
jgi:hypothetical protein